MSLDTGFMERSCESTHSLVRILTGKELHLLEGATIGLYTREATHLDEHGGYLGKLVSTRLKLTAALPHVTIDKTELNLFLHIYFFISDFFLNYSVPLLPFNVQN
jgi:hypothetical protein